MPADFQPNKQAVDCETQQHVTVIKRVSNEYFIEYANGHRAYVSPARIRHMTESDRPIKLTLSAGEFQTIYETLINRLDELQQRVNHYHNTDMQILKESEIRFLEQAIARMTAE